MAHTRKTIDDFLAVKRIAFVGLSRNAGDFSRMLFAEMVRRGYDLIPVNPHATEIDGRICVPSVRQIDPPPGAALLLNSASQTAEIVLECAERGIRRVWMYRSIAGGAVDPVAVEFCRENGIEVIAGECPFMFFPHTQWFHRLHGGFRKITGTFPPAA